MFANESESTNTTTTASSSSVHQSSLCRHFDFTEILSATKNFDESLVVGRGGFGKVYKGEVYDGSILVTAAIKRLDAMSNQGASEFWAEVEMLSKLRHCHLVSLIGYGNYEREMIIVYDYMPNGTLEDHLHKLERIYNSLQTGGKTIFGRVVNRFLFTDDGQNSGLSLRMIEKDEKEKWTLKLNELNDHIGISKVSSIDSICKPRAARKILSSPNVKAFSFMELKKATQNFRHEFLLGEGRLGYVFKGSIDEFTYSASQPRSKMLITVKKLKAEGFQGHKEWLTEREVTYLGQLQHPNLVKLIGYCSEGDNWFLVYEYMPKGSLENQLFTKQHTPTQPLSWVTRLKVAIGAARGLAFLHDAKNQIIHRNFKPSNILLDADFNTKLSDFGFAKAGPTGDRTHVSTQVMGTHEYDAPEYIATGRLTTKSDVYNFGVVLLELLSGRRAFDKDKISNEQDLIEWTKPYLGDEQGLFRIMDPKLEGQYPQNSAFAIATLASQCLNAEPKKRPRMSEILANLEELKLP